MTITEKSKSEGLSESWDEHTPAEACPCGQPAVNHGWAVDDDGLAHFELYAHGDEVHSVLSFNGVREIYAGNEAVDAELLSMRCPQCHQPGATARFATEMRLVFEHPGAIGGDRCVADSRAYVQWLTDPSVGERSCITQLLGLRYHSARMVGHTDVELAEEPEGWRVVRATGTADGHSRDVRPEVIRILRDGGVRLAHQE